ncbi:MAG: hypothetical protein ABI588_03620, partial [Arenimonas sp.]
MAERARPAATLGLLGAGLVLALLPAWLGSRWALAGLLLAQPPLLLAWSHWRGRNRGEPPTAWQQDLVGVALLWWLAFGLLSLLLAWPLLSLLENGALVPALLLSACAGFVLIALWRLWPAFSQAARSAHSFPSLVTIAARGGPRPTAFGLLLATLVFALLALSFALVWPGLVLAPFRQPLLFSFPLLSLLVHAAVHRVAALAEAAPRQAASAHLGTVEESGAQPPRSAPPEDVNEALYAALRNGR